MIRLELEAELISQGATQTSPFLGGMLHGVMERIVRTHAPTLSEQLGMLADNGRKYYAIQPPPFDLPNRNTAALSCAVILYGTAAAHAESLAALLTRHWHELRFDGHVDRVARLAIQVLKPSAEPAPEYFEPLPSGTHLSLRWLTPLLLENPGQRAAPRGQPEVPNLLRLTRSLSRRILALEPELAGRIARGSNEWITAEEAIRHQHVTAHELREVRWQYGSCSHGKTFQFTGLLGEQHFDGPIPAPILALLHYGRWFGVGQRTSMGQGMYEVICDNITPKPRSIRLSNPLEPVQSLNGIADTTHMRHRYPGDISRDQFEQIRPLLESARKRPLRGK